MKSSVNSVLLASCALLAMFQAPVIAAPVPICQSSVTDPDGDGWGMEHGRSCRAIAICTDTDGDGWGWDGVASCLMSDFYSKYYIGSSCTDSDGDGWGWDGYRSCRPQGYTAQNQSSESRKDSSVNQTISSANQPGNTSIAEVGGSCIDVDGDGYGWDGLKTCVLNDNQPAISQSKILAHDPGIDQCAKVQSGSDPAVELVTDVILTAGQSNAAGNKTVFDPNHPLDQVNPRILAWTSEQQWQVANPASQVWNADRFPKSPGQSGFNHPAYQIARSIVQQDSCRVVAIVASSASGQPISYWLDDVDKHFTLTSEKVGLALSQLPYKNKIDMIWWMQGESDNHPNYLDYQQQIQQLIQQYRSQSWFDSTRYFLANETGWFGYANKGIRLLAADADVNTNYSANPVNLHPDKTLHIESEEATIHFNETALRIIGDLVRDEYLFDYRARVAN